MSGAEARKSKVELSEAARWIDSERLPPNVWTANASPTYLLQGGSDKG